MADAYIQLPSDAGNLGKKVHTATVTTGDGEVHDHVFQLGAPLPAGSNLIGSVTISGGITIGTVDQGAGGVDPWLIYASDLDIRNLVFANDKVDASGSAVTAVVTASDLDIRNLVFATDKVDVSGSAVTAVVSATDLDIRNLTFAADKVDVSGSSISVTFPSSITVDAVDLDIRDLAFATDKVDVSGSAVTAVVTATNLDIRDLTFAADKVDVSGSAITATVSGSVTVSATDLDVRNLVFATDKVDVSGSTISVSFPPSVTVDAVDLDIRDLVFATDKVDVSGSAVTAVVTATNLDIRDLTFAADKVDVSGSAVTATVSGSVTVSATDLDIRNLVFATDKVDASGSAVTAVVTATDLDIRNLVFATDKVDVSGSTVTVSGTVTANQGGAPWQVQSNSLNLATQTTVAAISGQLPATLGQKAMTASLAVVLASDQSSIPVAATLAAETTKVIGTVNQGSPPWQVQSNSANIATETTVAAINTKLDTIDDWDESDRAKVNVIVGQAGITAGAGSVAANTPRVTHASDDPVTVSVQLIDDVIKILGTDTYTEASTKGAVIGAIRRDADTTLVDTTNEIAPLQVDARGFLKVEVFSGAEAIPVTLTSTTITGSVAVTNAALAYIDDTSTHSTGVSQGALMMAAATPTDASVNANDIGAVAMTTDRKLHVSVQDALPTGANAIGKLAANSGVDIGDVDVTSIIPGVGATNLGKREDDPHTSLDVGVMALAVRNDSNNQLAGTNLDYSPISVSASGMIKVFQLENLTDSDVGVAEQFLAIGGYDELIQPRVLNFYQDEITGASAKLAVSAHAGFSTSDTYTGAANGTAVGPLVYDSHKYFALQVNQTGGVTVWDVKLEASIDGVTYTTLLSHTQADLTGTTKWTTTPFPCKYYRTRCVTRTGGTSVTAYIMGTQ